MTYLLFLQLLYFSSSMQLFIYFTEINSLHLIVFVIFFDRAWPYVWSKMGSSFLGWEIALPVHEYTFCLWHMRPLHTSCESEWGGSGFRFSVAHISAFAEIHMDVCGRYDSFFVSDVFLWLLSWCTMYFFKKPLHFLV